MTSEPVRFDVISPASYILTTRTFVSVVAVNFNMSIVLRVVCKALFAILALMSGLGCFPGHRLLSFGDPESSAFVLSLPVGGNTVARH